MGKKHKGEKRKGEKLERVLGELQKLKSEVKALTKQQADLAVQIDKLSTKTSSARPAKKAVKKPAKPKTASATAARKASAATKRPVLVSASDAATG